MSQQSDGSFLSSSSSESDVGNGPSVALSVVCAILSPLVLAFVNLIDKIATDARVRSLLAYTAYIGAAEIVVGAVECASVSWENVHKADAVLFAWPVAAGVAYGTFMYLYFFAMRLVDASVLVGIMYIYPAVVCVLSYVVLGERLGALGYSGVAVLLVGAVVLSLDVPRALVRRCCAASSLLVESERQRQRRLAQQARAQRTLEDDDESCWCPVVPVLRRCCCSSDASSEQKQEYEKGQGRDKEDEYEDAVVMDTVSGEEALAGRAKQEQQEDKKEQDSGCCGCVPASLRLVLFAVPIVLLLGAYEFLLAFATKGGLTTFQVSGVEMCTQGAVLLSCLAVSSDARHGLRREAARNWLFGALNAVLTVASQLLMVYALQALPASVVSSLCAMQPLDILLLETVSRVSDSRVSQCAAFKLAPIALVIAGVVLISLRVFVESS